MENESFYDTWERFKDLWGSVSHMVFNLGCKSRLSIMVDDQTKSIVDEAAKGSILTKTNEEAYKLMEKLASNDAW